MDNLTFKNALEQELTGNILKFWIEKMEDPRGGFYGKMSGSGILEPDAVKGGILNARILWTFSSAYRVLGRPEYLKAAQRAEREILGKFIDPEYGGTFWSVNADGTPSDAKKQFYAIAFTIYGLAEYFRATADDKALEAAVALYRKIEEHSFDPEFGGYLEACTRDWQPIEDMRLSEKDQNDAKTMNTHLHILEAYTNLYRVWKDDGLREQLRNLILVFLGRICGPDGHLQLFFDEKWTLNGQIQSFGHDIECSWLLWEAAEVLGDEEILARCRPVCSQIAMAGMEGYAPGRGIIYEWNIGEGEKNLNRDWWPQAEAIVGCWNQYQMNGDEKWREAALDFWEFIKEHVIAPDGEWYWGAVPAEDGGEGFTPNTTDDRAGFWKCPYHNGRMCLEMIERLG